ncbi:MAG: AHH domain-containing protein [Bacteroidales bacterium]|nr:AHH domain-containing protein [Bacteroidales bacterium]
MNKRLFLFMLLTLLMFVASDCKNGKALVRLSKVTERLLSGKCIGNIAKYSTKFGHFVTYVKEIGKGSKEVCYDLGHNVAKRYKVVKRQVITIASKSKILKAAAEFRQNGTWSLQYVKSNDIPLDKISKQKLGNKAVAGILYDNMVTLGLPEDIAKTEYNVFQLQKTLFRRTQAHHIISGNSPAADESRILLKKFGIDINDGRNGILLPNNKAHFAKGSKHGTSTTEYDKAVYERIKNCSTKEELLKTLDEIKNDLYNGVLPIIKQHEFIN